MPARPLGTSDSATRNGASPVAVTIRPAGEQEVLNQQGEIPDVERAEVTVKRRRVAAEEGVGVRIDPTRQKQVRVCGSPPNGRCSPAEKLGALDRNGIRCTNEDRIGIVVGRRLGLLSRRRFRRVRSNFAVVVTAPAVVMGGMVVRLAGGSGISVDVGTEVVSGGLPTDM